MCARGDVIAFIDPAVAVPMARKASTISSRAV